MILTYLLKRLSGPFPLWPVNYTVTKVGQSNIFQTNFAVKKITLKIEIRQTYREESECDGDGPDIRL